MNWPVLLMVVVVVLLGGWLIRRTALISESAARGYLAQGAMIVDVRSPEEFSRRHVEGALNVPLSGMPVDVRRRIPDTNQVLLLHCLSGGRSAVAARMLKGAGYTRVFNLGSYGRAQRIARGRQTEEVEINCESPGR